MSGHGRIRRSHGTFGQLPRPSRGAYSMDKACSQIFSGPELVRHENVDTHKGEGTTQCWGSTASKLRSRAQDRLRIVGSGLTIFTERLWIVCSVGPAYKLKAKVRILFEMLRLKPWSLYPLRIVHLSTRHLPLLTSCPPAPVHIDSIYGTLSDPEVCASCSKNVRSSRRMAGACISRAFSIEDWEICFPN